MVAAKQVRLMDDPDLMSMMVELMVPGFAFRLAQVSSKEFANPDYRLLLSVVTLYAVLWLLPLMQP